MSRIKLLLGSFSLFSLVAACGGAVSPIGSDLTNESSSSSSSGGGSSSGGSSSGGSSSGRVCGAPVCDVGDRMVGRTSSACPQDAACYSRSNSCGDQIWCAEDNAQCAAVPTCEAGYNQVGTTCPPGPSGSDCHTVTVCGSTIACIRWCEGPRPMCDPGDSEYPACPTDAPCYTRSVCGFTIYCVPSFKDGGLPPPPQF